MRSPRWIVYRLITPWQRTGNDGSVHDQRWPSFDPALLATDYVEIVVQVDGKVRARLKAETGSDQSTIEALALGDADIQRAL